LERIQYKPLIGVKIMEPFIPKQINYLSNNHIYSAALFEVKAKEYEENNKYKCLSYGCAKWAVNSSLLFADNFYLLIGKEKFFNFTKDRLMEIGFELI
jgi:hypothetical protein